MSSSNIDSSNQPAHACSLIRPFLARLYILYIYWRFYFGVDYLQSSHIDFFNVIVFIRATDLVITMLCHVTIKLWMAKTFPVPLIPN